MSDSLYLVLAAAAVGVVWLFAARKRAGRRRDERGLPMPRVEGYQVMSPLHPRMTRGCVFDLGLQYGRGFRRKEGPALPHGPDCQCRVAPFSFSGTEVFNGSLRKIGEVRSTDPAFPQAACQPLLDALKQVNAEPIPETLTGYLEQVGEVPDLAPEHREPVRRFLEARFAYLRSLHSPSGVPVREPPQPSDGV